MVRHALLAASLALVCAPAMPAQDKPPAIAGYVTAVTSSTTFDVNGTHVLCDTTTQFNMAEPDGHKLIPKTPGDSYIGQAVDVYGKADKKTHTIHATEVVTYPPDAVKRNGTAIIDAIPADAAQGNGERLLSADGYRILITPKTQTTFTAPLTSLSDIRTNVWIRYNGKQRADGVLVAEEAVFTQNGITHGEDKLREKNEYDPKSVDPSSKQSAVSKHFLGPNPKKVPPYDNPAMQARIDRIGQSLIPAYQRDLPSDDPAKINFRFQLVDQPKWNNTWALPNGITLIPRQCVERMQNDSQLAELLASDIAYVIEKQTFRQIPTRRKMTAAQAAGTAAGLFVPGLGLATDVADMEASSIMLRHEREQSGRVSLVLLHNAGYDIHQAPLAWWLLAPKKPTPMIDTPLPERAAYLYQALGTTWKDLPAAAARPGFAHGSIK